jgi:O-antigen/teichoic acid export membrane protein
MSGPSSRRSLKLGPATVATFTATMVGTATRFLVQILLISWLGTASYGAFVVARGWGEMLAKLPDRGYALGSVRFIPRYQAGSHWGHYRGLLIRAIRGTLLVSTALAAIAIAVVGVLGGDRELMAGLSLAVAISLAAILRATLQGSHAYLPAVTLMELGQPSLMAVGFLVLHQVDSLTVVSALLMVLASWFAVSGMEALLLKRRTPRAVSEATAEFDTEAWTRSTRPLFIAQLGIGVINISDVLVVGATVGKLEAGVYAIATRIAAIGRMANAAVESLVSPQIAAAAHEGQTGIPKIQAIIDRAIRISIGPSFAFAIFAALAAGPVLGLLGKDFASGETVLMILVLGNLADAVSGPSGHVVSLVGSERNYAVIMVASAAALVALSIPAGLMFGIVGVAVVRTAISFSWNAALFVVARRSLGLWCLPKLPARSASAS